MNWHNGLILIWQLHGCVFESWRAQIKLYIYIMVDLGGMGRVRGNPS